MSIPRTRRLIGVLLAFLSLCGCQERNDPDRSVVVTEFRANECRNGYPSDELFTHRPTVDYPALLRCIAWETMDDGHLVLDLINFSAGCGFDGHEADTLWRGEASQEGNDLHLAIDWDFEAPSACGNCLHDFSFRIEGLGEKPDTLALAVAIRSCTGDCSEETERFALPLGSGDTGVRCKYIGISERAVTDYGKLHQLPVDGMCDGGLALASIEGSDVCIAECTESSDCPLQELLACQSGHCSLSEPLDQPSR